MPQGYAPGLCPRAMPQGYAPGHGSGPGVIGVINPIGAAVIGVINPICPGYALGTFLLGAMPWAW